MEDIIYYIMCFANIECHSCMKQFFFVRDIMNMKKMNKYYYCDEICYNNI